MVYKENPKPPPTPAAALASSPQHGLRKTKASIIYEKTGNVEAVRRLLGHKSVIDTSLYLGIEDADATELARNIDI